MSRFPNRRLVAATVLAVTLAVFTLPAAAAPIGAWTSSAWELPTLLSWFDSLWAGIFGGDREVVNNEPWRFGSVYDQQDATIEPDGTPLRMTTATEDAGGRPGFTGGSW